MHKSMDKKIKEMFPKILYIAPLRDFSGYAHAARDYVRALDAYGTDLVTRDVIYDGGNYKRTEREQELFSRDVQDIDIVIQHTTPNETERKDGVFNVNIFCWETDRIPDEWVKQLNQMDLVIVSCDENLRACRRSDVVVPIEKVHFACDIDKYQKEYEPFAMPDVVDNRFKFLSVCQFSKKKGVDVLLKAYFSEFTPEENVVLILKIYVGPKDGPNEKKVVQNLISEMRRILRLNGYPPVQLIHEVMSDEDVSRLYTTSDCYVLPARGEGWSIPHFDALGFGLPAIGTNWGGPTEFITNECGWLIPYSMTPVCNMMHPFSYLYTAKDNWAEPNVCELQAAMREAFTLWKYDYRKRKLNWRKGDTGWKQRQDAARERVKDFSYDKIGPKLHDTIMKYYTQWRKSNVC